MHRSRNTTKKTSFAQLSISLLVTLVVSTSAQAATVYNAPTVLDRPGFASTQLWDVNDSGVIVGTAVDSAGVSVGFTYSGGSFSSMSHPAGALGTTLTGIASDGTVVGGYNFVGPNVENGRGFIYSGGVFTDFSVGGANWTLIRHTSANGRYLTGDWRADDGFNNGFAYDTVTSQLFLFPADNGSTVTQGANNAGLVTGSYLRPVVGGPTESGAFIFDTDTSTRTEFAIVDGLLRPRFHDINESGEVVGWAGDLGFAGPQSDLFEFAAPAGMIALAYGLNNTGTVVGFYQEPNTGINHGWVTSAVTNVPEPAALALALVGIALLALHPQAHRRA